MISWRGVGPHKTQGLALSLSALAHALPGIGLPMRDSRPERPCHCGRSSRANPQPLWGAGGAKSLIPSVEAGLHRPRDLRFVFDQVSPVVHRLAQPEQPALAL